MTQNITKKTMMNKKGMHWALTTALLVGLFLLLTYGWYKLSAVAAPKFFP